MATDAIDFINGLPIFERARLFLLTDYELEGQQHTGLDIVQDACAQRCIVVTSHFNKQDVIKAAVALNTRVLPKLLASEVEIVIAD